GQRGRGVRGVADLGGHDKRHAPSGFKQAGCSHEERCPRRCETGELCSYTLAHLEGTSASVAVEGLITDEWRVPRGAFETVICVRSPREKLLFMNQRPGRTSHCMPNGLRVLLNAYTVTMARYEATVTTRRVKQAILLTANCPRDKR